ncbi:MAG TPA: YkvA family protein [Candidatus Binatia bacterium]|nr:YkvA family protein [Candidatus Binatia bacterium]
MTDQPLYHTQRASRDAGRPATLPRRSDFWRRLRRLLRRIPLIDRTLAAYYCARDPETPLYARVALFGAIAYFIMPFDLIPDFIPVVAHIDDAAVMLLALRMVGHKIKPEHHERARLTLDRWTGPADA